MDYRCRLQPFPIDGVWKLNTSIVDLCGQKQCPDKNYCGNPYDMSIIPDKEDRNIKHLNFGITSFDTYGNSILVIAQFVAIKSFQSFINIFWKSVVSAITTIYFVSVVIVLSFFLMNLFLGALFKTFTSLQDEENKKLQRKSTILNGEDIKNIQNETVINTGFSLKLEQMTDKKFFKLFINIIILIDSFAILMIRYYL